MPEASPSIGNERLERAGSTIEIGYLNGAGAGADFAIEVTYEGLYELAEETLADGASKLLDEHFSALGGWIARCSCAWATSACPSSPPTKERTDANSSL
jgi:hypothetical protein